MENTDQLPSFEGILAFSQLAVHFVGNAMQEEELKLSKALTRTDERTQELLMKYFLKPLKGKEYYHLHHENDLKYNEVYGLTSEIFDDPDAFFLRSIELAKHLYQQCDHPNIKAGELYCVFFDSVELDGELTEAVGLFKSESKASFLKVASGDGTYAIASDEGLDIDKLDKACMIYNLDRQDGYRVQLMDRTNKGDEAKYWKERFLNVRTRDDSFHYTQNYMKMCKEFVTERLPEEFQVERTDQIDLMNRSVAFFKKQEQFDRVQFEEEVIQDPGISESFQRFRKEFADENNLPMVDEFDISTQAVKKQAKVFKSILKLDKNFHIYVHGNRELIEQGYDEEKHMKYYKVYYREEQ